MNGQGFVFRIWEDITPRELLERYRDGYAVYRTAHIGNQYPSNLLLASIGLPLYLYDKTVFTKDHNYHPAYIIKEGERQVLLEPTDIVVPYGQCDEHISPSHLHYTTLQALFGSERIFTEAELFLRHQEKLHSVLSVIAKYIPSSFDRYIDSFGRMTPIIAGRNRRESLADDAIHLLRELQRLVKNPAVVSRSGGDSSISTAYSITLRVSRMVGEQKDRGVRIIWSRYDSLRAQEKIRTSSNRHL